MGCISATSRLHLGCTSATPRLYLGRLLDELRYDGRPVGSLDEVDSALDGHVRREEQMRAGDEARGAEYALGDLAECVRLLVGVVTQAGARGDDKAGLEALRKEVRGAAI